jgi:hypothetical protein
MFKKKEEEVRDAASNSAYYGYRYHAVPSTGFGPTTLWLRVRRPNHSATTLHMGSYVNKTGVIKLSLLSRQEQIGTINNVEKCKVSLYL